MRRPNKETVPEANGEDKARIPTLGKKEKRDTEAT